MSIKVSDWSTTPGSNTSVDGVAIGESVPFANMNNMGRAIMSAVRYEVASIGSNVSAAAAPDIGSVGGALTILGVSTIAGFATAPAGLVRTLHFETATPIVPGASLSASFTSITTVKGDVMQVRSLGAGAWKVENFSRLTPIGKHKLWIPAAAMLQNTTLTPAAATVAPSASVNYYTLDFDASANETAHFTLSMPSSWNEGTLTFVPVWTAASGSGDVVWRLNAQAVNNDDAIPTSYTNGANTTDTLITAGDIHRGPESSALTCDGTPATNSLLMLRILRFATDVGDTLNADARLIGIELYFTTDAAVDVA
jgi:hypothetical protein